MTHPALQDLLSPPLPAGRLPAQPGLEAMAETLLERFRQEDKATPLFAGPVAGSTDVLSAEAEDALYAWGVMCYSQGRYADAAALFGAALRRRSPSHRLSRARGAALLAWQDAAGAAEAFAQAAQLEPTDAEVVFHWAQAEALQSHRDEALLRLRCARALAQAHPSRWPDLSSWCDALMRHLDSSTPTSDRH